MLYVFGLALILALCFLTLCVWQSWALALRERTSRYYLGAVATTIITIISFWYVLFAGVFQ